MNNFHRRGRLIIVDDIKWRYRVGKSGGIVAYSEHGKRICSHGALLLGMTYADFDDDEVSVTPRHIAKWIKSF